MKFSGAKMAKPVAKGLPIGVYYYSWDEFIAHNGRQWDYFHLLRRCGREKEASINYYQK